MNDKRLGIRTSSLPPLGHRLGRRTARPGRGRRDRPRGGRRGPLARGDRRHRRSRPKRRSTWGSSIRALLEQRRPPCSSMPLLAGSRGWTATVSAAESDALSKLGERLGVPERPRVHAEAIAREIDAAGAARRGSTSARYDLVLPCVARWVSGCGRRGPRTERECARAACRASLYSGAGDDRAGQNQAAGPSTSEIGSVLAYRYEVVRELRARRDLDVYLCKDIVTGDQVALKRLRSPEKNSNRARKRAGGFHQEARAVAAPGLSGHRPRARLRAARRREARSSSWTSFPGAACTSGCTDASAVERRLGDGRSSARGARSCPRPRRHPRRSQAVEHHARSGVDDPRSSGVRARPGPRVAARIPPRLAARRRSCARGGRALRRRDRRLGRAGADSKAGVPRRPGDGSLRTRVRDVPRADGARGVRRQRARRPPGAQAHARSAAHAARRRARARRQVRASPSREEAVEPLRVRGRRPARLGTTSPGARGDARRDRPGSAQPARGSGRLRALAGARHPQPSRAHAPRAPGRAPRAVERGQNS